MATRKLSLKGLKVVELKKILKQRDYQADNKNNNLQQRLEGENPDTYLFDDILENSGTMKVVLAK